MSQKNETVPLILALLITGAILGGGWWWFNNKSTSNVTSTSPIANSNDDNTSTNSANIADDASDSNDIPVTFSFPTDVASGTAIKVNGATSMVQINQAIKRGFENQFPQAAIATNGQGTGVGLDLLQQDKIDIAAISRPLTEQEKATGLNAVPIARDAISVVVGVDNSFRRGLSSIQVADIFQGKITNWSDLGGKSSTIRVINRPPVSGTRQIFQQEALNGANFGTSANFTTLNHDATTPILRALSTDGISYATYAQVANQQTVRTVAIDGLTPEAANYPYYRVLYYAYQEPASPKVEDFLGYVLSPQGQKVILSGG